MHTTAQAGAEQTSHQRAAKALEFRFFTSGEYLGRQHARPAAERHLPDEHSPDVPRDAVSPLFEADERDQPDFDRPASAGQAAWAFRVVVGIAWHHLETQFRVLLNEVDKLRPALDKRL